MPILVRAFPLGARLGKVRRPNQGQAEKSVGVPKKSSFKPKMSTFMKLRLPLFCALAASALLLPGCAATQRIVLCPGAAILADTASVTVFRPGAPADPSGEAFTAYLYNTKTDCTLVKDEVATYSSLTLSFRAVRPPSPDAASYSLPYFVAVNQAERLISKQIFTVRFNFAPGATAAMAEENLDQTVVTLERGHLPNDYQLLSGFQLTDAQRAYNLKMGRYLP